MKFVLTADWHIQGEMPRCRLDLDWLATQRGAVRFVVDFAKERDLPLVVAGDIFNTPRTATPAVVMLIEELMRWRDHTYILAGNHDLPYHSYAQVGQCSFGVLRQYFKELHLAGDELLDDEDSMTAAPFGMDVPGEAFLAFTHQLVFPDEKSKPGPAVGKTAAELADQFPAAGWIFTGDYHHAFDVTVAPQRIVDSGEIPEPGDYVRVVNPGCLLRQAADMMDYQCKIAVVDTTAGTVEWVDVPDPGEIITGGAPVVTDRYLREAEERTEQVDAFLEALSTSGTVTLDFEHNLDQELNNAELDPEVRAEVLLIRDQINKEK